MESNSQIFNNFCTKYASGLNQVMASVNLESLKILIDDLLLARSEKRQIFIFGNGGSASTASHLANDLTKDRFGLDHLLFRVISLNDNASTITATANDFGYESIFVNQLKNLLQPKDLVLAISSSGNSENIIRAVDYANAKSANTYGIVGFDGGRLKKSASNLIYIPTKVGQYGFMEDYCLILTHIISIFIYEQDRATITKSQSEGSTQIVTLDHDLDRNDIAQTVR